MLSWKQALSNTDMLSLVSYLLLQDRVGEAKKVFARITWQISTSMEVEISEGTRLSVYLTMGRCSTASVRLHCRVFGFLFTEALHRL